MELSIAAVSFLNTVPLVELFCRDGFSGVQLIKALPSRLPSMLASGQSNVGLLPLVEVFRGKSAGFFPGTCIGCLGAVDSVKLFYSGNIKNVTVIEADRGSRSSVALLKILLAENYGIFPHFQETKPVPGTKIMPGQGVLVIGDLCFEFEKELISDPALFQADLGLMWQEMTGLPFVFAVWAAAPGWPEAVGSSKVRQASEVLNHARDFGMSILPELAERESSAGKLGFQGEATASAIEYYFRHSLHYKLEDKQLAGIKEFHRLCLHHKQITGGSMPPIL